MSDNAYSIQAKPGDYRGHRYDSQLEIRTAKLLDKNGVVYAPHQKFKVYHRNGDIHHYTVDFLFYKPQKFVGITPLIDFLEVKGVISKHDINRKDALEYCYDCRGYVAETQLIEMWERDGLLPDNEKVWHQSSYSVEWFNR